MVRGVCTMIPPLRNTCAQQTDRPFTTTFPGPASGSAQAEDFAVGGRVTFTADKIVEGHGGRLDEVPGDERRSFPRSLLGTLDTALPLQDGPAVEARLGQQREHALEIDLPIAQGAEPAGSLRPRLVAAVDPHPAAGPELGVLDMEAGDALPVELDELQVIELLQQQVARVVVDARGRVVPCVLQEQLEGGAVEEVRPRMKLIPENTTVSAGHVEQRQPAAGQFLEGLVDQAR